MGEQLHLQEVIAPEGWECHSPLKIGGMEGKSATIRGVPSEVVLGKDDGIRAPCAVNLHNTITVSQDRLGKRMARLSSVRMKEICAALRFSLGCDLS